MTLTDQLEELRKEISSAMKWPGTAMLKLPGILKKLLDLLREIVERVEGSGRGK